MSIGRRDDGQATVELALVLPLVALMALAVVQTSVVAYRQLLVVHAAREGARAAAVSDDDRLGAAERAVAGAGGLERAALHVSVREEGELVEVEVTFDEPTDVALVGALIPSLELRARAAMQIES